MGEADIPLRKHLQFQISTSRMTLKQNLLLCLASSLTMAISFGSSRNGRCYIKSDSTKTFSNMLHIYGVGLGRVSKSRASGRVPGRCLGSFPKLTRDFVTKNICPKVNVPSNGQGLRVPIYLSGKPDCKGNTETNHWMDPVKKGDVCCAALPFYGVIGCQRGSDKYCNC